MDIFKKKQFVSPVRNKTQTALAIPNGVRKPAELKPLLEPLSVLKKLLEKAGCQWMIIGGVAASLLGKPRFTADIDAVALIEDKELSNLLKVARRFGLTARIKDAVEFAQKNRVLLLKHTKTGINVDLSLGFLPFEKEAIKRSKRFKIANITFNLPTPEDLIIFKAVAHRPRDIEDIREIVKIHTKVNKKYIKRVVKEFASVLGMPEIWQDIEFILSA
jgi:predicted nucleotidyltransferase